MLKSTKSNAGEGNPAEIPLSTKGNLSFVSVFAEKISMIVFECSLNAMLLPSVLGL